MKPPRGDYTSLEAFLFKSSIEAMTFPEYGKVLALIKLSKKDDSLDFSKLATKGGLI